MHHFQGLIYRISLLGLCSAITINPVIATELYKWVDKNGVTQYSQSPPTDNTSVKTLNLPNTAADPAAIEKLKSRVETADKLRDTRKEDEQLKLQVEETKALNEENCRRAKALQVVIVLPKMPG